MNLTIVGKVAKLNSVYTYTMHGYAEYANSHVFIGFCFLYYTYLSRFMYSLSSGEEVIRIDYKDERIWSYRFTCEKGGTIVNILAGVPLEKCVMVEVVLLTFLLYASSLEVLLSRIVFKL